VACRPDQVGRFLPATQAQAGVDASCEQPAATSKALLQGSNVVARCTLQGEPFGIGEFVQDVVAALGEGRSPRGAPAEPVWHARVPRRPLADQLQDGAGEVIWPGGAEPVTLPQRALPLVDDLGEVEPRIGERCLGRADAQHGKVRIDEGAEAVDGPYVAGRVPQRGLPGVVDCFIRQVRDQGRAPVAGRVDGGPGYATSMMVDQDPHADPVLGCTVRRTGNTYTPARRPFSAARHQPTRCAASKAA
jgi:hypothetical protein